MARIKELRFAQRVAWAANARRLGTNWRTTAQFLLIGSTFVVLLALVPNLPARELLIGLAIGLWAGMLTVAIAGFDDPQVRGDLAEQWTAEAFAGVRGWRITNGLRFHDGDLDHLVVTPSGVLAVETKYRYRQSDKARLTRQRHQDLNAAARTGRKARSLLLSKDVDAPFIPVMPVLMIWGKGSPVLPAGYKRVDEVYVLDGEHPGLWSHLFNAPRVPASVQCDIAEAVAGFQRGQVAYRETTEASRIRMCWSEFRAGIRNERAEQADKRALSRSLRRRHRAAPNRQIAPTAYPATPGD